MYQNSVQIYGLKKIVDVMDVYPCVKFCANIWIEKNRGCHGCWTWTWMLDLDLDVGPGLGPSLHCFPPHFLAAKQAESSHVPTQ